MLLGIVCAFACLGVTGCARGAAPQLTQVERPSVAVSQAMPALPRAEVMDAARRAFACGQAAGHFAVPLITVIDYSLPSTQPRLWVIDLATDEVLFHELVAHGRNSGNNFATSFSDEPDSKQSSLGLFRTAEPYWGRHGYTLRLDGLEAGVNGRARERFIVLHGADYVGPDSIAHLGRLGRSWGCPAVSRDVSGPLIDRIRGGTALFVYYPDRVWMSSSAFLHCARNAEATSDEKGIVTSGY
jgi:hypothetical protein